MLQENLDVVEKAIEDAFGSVSLQESLRLIVAIGNRLNLHSLLLGDSAPSAFQLMRFRKKAAAAIDLNCLERVLGTRGHLDVGAKMSHFMVALCAPTHSPGSDFVSRYMLVYLCSR